VGAASARTPTLAISDEALLLGRDRRDPIIGGIPLGADSRLSA